MSDKTKPDEPITAGLLVIGDEILSGRTRDENIGYIASYLTDIGIDLEEVRVVPDDCQRIVDAVNALRQSYGYVFTTGGIGPTHDDITADSIAAAFDVPVRVDPRAVAMMRERFAVDKLDDNRLRMARIPEGAELVDNAISKTPGFMIENVIVMAGIPRVMQVMLDAVTPMLRTGKKMLSTTVVAECAESDIAEPLLRLQDAYPDVKMGSYPYFKDGRMGTQLVLRCRDQSRLAAAAGDVRNIAVAPPNSDRRGGQP